MIQQRLLPVFDVSVNIVDQMTTLAVSQQAPVVKQSTVRGNSRLHAARGDCVVNGSAVIDIVNV